MTETIEENFIEEEKEKKIQPNDCPSSPSGSSKGEGTSGEEKRIRSKSEPTSSRASNNSLIGS